MKTKTEIKDKLNKAFRTLRTTYGFLARQNFCCCQGCAWAEAAEIVKTKQYRGIVFYHKQDGDDLNKENPYCFLAYGASSGYATDEEAIRIGKTVVACLLVQGLKVEWSGTANSRILVRL